MTPKITNKIKQESILKVFAKLLNDYELTKVEIDLLVVVQGTLIQRLVKDGKISKPNKTK